MKRLEQYWSLHEEIKAHLSWPATDLFDYSGHPLANDQTFNQLALKIFDFQLAYNPLYRRYAQIVKATEPATWREIPALWTTAFKRGRVATFPASERTAYFCTSGTTEKESGVHEFRDLDLYRQGALSFFRCATLPDCSRIKMLSLTPSPSEAPHSSLVFMIHQVQKRFGTKGSDYFLKNERLDEASLLRVLNNICKDQVPVFLLGTSFAFVYLLEALQRRKLRLVLPPQSRIMETGGFKGRVREVPKREFYAALQNSLGIPRSHCINEYGMTELSSQFYDMGFAFVVKGRHLAENKWTFKACPPWTRIMIVDPWTGKEVPRGHRGLIRIYDLANVGSAVSIQTEDVGVQHHEGFEVLGRIQSAPPRGCSLDIERIVAGEKGNEAITVREN